MEIIAHSDYLDITLQQDEEELEKILLSDLEGNILLVRDEPPYNPSSGKKCILHLEENAPKLIEVNYSPMNTYWDNIKEIKIIINHEAYDKICFYGSVRCEPPETPVDILIQV